MSAPAETLAQVYATALLDLAFEKGVHAEVLAELKAFGAILEEERDFATFLYTPNIRQQAKTDVVRKVFGGEFSDTTLHFILITIDKRRQAYLPEMLRAFQAGYHERMGEQVVRVETAVAMQDEQRNRLTEILKKKLEKEIILDERVNERLLGGLVLRVGDSRIDGSLRTQLETIGARLDAARCQSEDCYEN